MIDEDKLNALELLGENEYLHKEIERLNNIINAIMPFDTENCVKWDSNYLKGFSSEKRDVNIIKDQAKKIN